MQIGHKMTELEAFEVLSVVLEHPVYILFKLIFLLLIIITIHIQGVN